MEYTLNGKYGANPESVMFVPGFEYSTGLSLRGLRNVKINAADALFWVDGFMEPVGIRGCENLTLSGLKIDHKRKPYSAGKITEIDKKNKTEEFS